MTVSEPKPLSAALWEPLERWLRDAPWHLRFPAALEELFESETSAQRRMWLIRYGLVGLGLINIFVLTDMDMFPDIASFASWLRLGVVTPVSLAMIIAFRFRISPWLREFLQTQLALLALIMILLFATRSTHPNAAFCLAGLNIVTVYAFNVARVRFPFALGTALATTALYLFAMPHVPSLPPSTRVFHTSVVLSGLVLGLFANRAQERAERTSYLLNLSERLRQENLSRDNLALSVLAGTDPLTGLANRRHFDAALERMLHQPPPCAVVMFDVDHFKAYNDTYGHHAGDLCLQAIAKAMAQSLRDGDLVARLGGEEFAVLLPGADLHMSIVVTRRILAAIEALAIPHSASQTRSHVTVSAGIALCEEGEAGPDVVERADAALYRSKAGGRNGWRIDGVPHPL